MRGTTTGLRNRHLDVSVNGVRAHPGAAETAVRPQLSQINDLRDFEQFTRPNEKSWPALPVGAYEGRLIGVGASNSIG